MPISALYAFGLAALHAMTLATGECSDVLSPDGIIPLRTDDTGRYQAAVMLNGTGPFWFMVDTAATAPALSGKAAARLKLQSSSSVQLIGGNGNASTGQVVIRDYCSDLFGRHDEPMTLGAGLSADGVLGMNAFTSGRIEVGLAEPALAVGPSGQVPAGFIVQSGTLRAGSIMIVDVVIDGVPAKAVIDTGAPYNIGNMQLQSALGLKSGDARLLTDNPITDAMARQASVSKATLGNLVIGGITFSRPTLRFAEMPVLHQLGLDGPALIIGVEQFAHMQAIAIDYPRAQLQLQP